MPTLCHQNNSRVTTTHITNNQNIIYVNKPDKKHRFYFVDNAWLFDSLEQTEISPVSNMAVNIAAFFIFSSKSSDILTKQLQFLLMIIANTNSETSKIDCWFDFARKYRFAW